MTSINVRNLRDDLSFGSIIEGVNWDNIDDEDTRQQIRDTFVERGMIVFKDMEPTAKMQVALSKIFGPLKDHPTKTTPRDDETGDEAQGVIDMFHEGTSDPNFDEGIVIKGGKRLARYSPWHFDHCYNDELNYAGVLRSPVNAPAGEMGRTGFMDGIECYKQFPKELRDRIEGLNIVYTLDTRLSKMRFGVDFEALAELPSTADLLKEVAIFPRAMHPAVWTRPTGEKVLHIGPWMAVGIEHHEDPEGDALFDEVCHMVNKMGEGTSAYWHQWEPTDMVIWDNTRMLHAVEGCDPKYDRRTIRSTIRGDYGLGYFEDGKKIGEVFREVA
ncbi:MAG: TauD/TfdA family dioxygenase [Novosphingobium sp.]|nr:TauD/TfdA family dioxygenase [Novosphingobium sp.]